MSRIPVSAQEARRGHPGLRIDKHLDLETPEWKDVAAQRLDDAVYRRAYERWERYWTREAPESVMWVKGRVRGRLAVGLGAKGALEVGLRLSHSYGTPIIPGSAIKGVLRKAAADLKPAKFLFGASDEMGFVEFQDAWWIPESRCPLVMDVVTPHHPKYYRGEGAPTDCDSPIPVQFLSVRGSFLFVAEAPPRWKKYVQDLLTDTLANRGIGAKTAAGYGRFVFGG